MQMRESGMPMRMRHRAMRDIDMRAIHRQHMRGAHMRGGGMSEMQDGMMASTRR